MSKKSFGSLYDQSESADLDDLQIERTHAPSHFCVDNAGICYISLLFILYIFLTIIYSLVSLRKPDRISRIITRAPVFISATSNNQTKASFGIDLRIADLHHNPTFLSYLNCSATKQTLEGFHSPFTFHTENQSADIYRSQNVICKNCANDIDLNDKREYFVQFNITERHRLLDRHSNLGEYSKPLFKSTTFVFPKNLLDSSEFNIFTFLFNDPDYFSFEKNSSNYIYSEHSKLNSPSLSVSFTIDTNYTQFNALDFIYYYLNPIIKKYFTALIKIFDTCVLFALSINLFYSKHKIGTVTRFFCLTLGLLSFLATNPFEEYIDSIVYNKINMNHTMTFIFNPNESKNDLSLRFGCFFFALFINTLRLFLCLQYCFICSHDFTSMFQLPNSFATFGISIFYLLFIIVDYKAQYSHEKQLFRYSSLSYTNRSTLIDEQQFKLQHVYYDPSVDTKTSSHNLANVPPLPIEKFRIFFILIHTCFTIYLIRVSYERVNDGADPNSSAENNRLMALILFSSVPNISAILVHCLFVSYSVLQRTIFPDVLLFASNEFCVAAILLLFRGVKDDDDNFQKLGTTGFNHHFH